MEGYYRKRLTDNWDPEEQKRKAEEEMKERKEMALTAFYGQKLSIEQAMTTLNTMKLVQKWRQILRERMNQQLKHDVLAIRHTFENICDKKDSMAVSLVKDLYEDDVLHLYAFQNHISTIDRLAALQKQRIDELARMSEDEVNMMKGEFDAERERMMQGAKDEENYLVDVCIAMDLKAQEDEYNDLCAFTAERTEIKQYHSQMRQILRLQVETRVDELWALLRQDLALYLDNSEQRKIAFAIIRDREVAAANEMQMRYNKIDRLKRQVAALKKKIRFNAKEVDAKSTKLKHDLHDLYRQYAHYRGMMHKRSQYNAQKTIKLSMESYSALQHMKRQIEKGKRVLKMAEICRKLETTEEKVVPFRTSMLNEEEESAVQSIEDEPPTEPLANIMYEYQCMDNFWGRFNKVLLDKRALDKELQDLRARNDGLRVLLRQYMNNISVTHEVMSGPNSLLISSTTGKKEAERYMDSRRQAGSHLVPYNVVDGAHLFSRNVR